MIIYTDMHDVDEEMMAVCCYNGEWKYDVWAGIMCRHTANIPTEVWHTVASKYNKNSTPVTESRVL